MRSFTKKIISIFLCSAMFLQIIPVKASTPDTAVLTGQSSSSSEVLASGVKKTTVVTSSSSVYSKLEFNIVEADLSNQNLYLNTVFGGATAEHANVTGSKMVSTYASKTDKTPVAAVNADLWWMYTGTGLESSNGGKKMLNSSSNIEMPLGFTMSHGEIYTSDRIPQESYYTSSGTSLHYEDYVSFGITDDYVPVISNPNAIVDIKNSTQGISFEADGINRLPAYNSLIMYTDKGCANSYANDDAFEVLISIDSTSDYVIKHDTKISGKVIGIYGPDDSSNPTMTADSNNIILTARGSKYDLLSSFAIDDTVEIEVSVIDQSGKYTEEWQRVTDAVAGHLQFAKDGVYSESIALESNYPATVVGITNTGNFIMLTLGSCSAGSRKGISQTSYDDLARDLNLRDGILLDGGGSSTMVVLDSSEYKIANKLAYVTERALVDMLVLSTGKTRCEQGEIPNVPQLYISPEYIDFTYSRNMAYVNGIINDTSYSYSKSGLKLTSVSGRDPYFTIDYEISKKRISASNNKYIVIEYMIPQSNKYSSYTSQLFYNTGSNYTASQTYSKTFSGLIADGKYHVMTIDMSSSTGWSGNINNFRFDYFDTSGIGDILYIKSISLNNTGNMIESYNYIYAEQGSIIGSTLNSYLTGVNSYELFDSSDATITTAALSETGILFNTCSNNDYNSYFIVVVGDTDGDSNINIADAVELYQHILTNDLQLAYEKSADIDSNNTVNILDLIMLLNSI